MRAVSIMLDEGDGAAQEAEAVEQLLEELAPVEQLWRLNHWANYLGKAVQPQRIGISLQVLPDAEAYEIELVVDESLFRQLASIYALWGWSALVDTLALLEKRDSPNPALVGLVHGACLLLRDRIAMEIAAVEAELGVRALQRWQETGKRLAEWSGAFKRYSINDNSFLFQDKDTWDKANAALDKYHALNRKRKKSENERKSAPGLGRNYVPGVNDDAYPLIDKNWGAREKQFMKEAAEALGELHRVCPAAVFVADATADRFDTNSTWFAPNDAAGTREKYVGGKVVRTLKQSIRQLDALCASTRLDGVAEFAAKPGGLAPETGETWNTSRRSGTAGLIAAERVVARRSLESWDIGNAIKRVVTLRVTWEQALLAFSFEPERNTVLSVLPLVREYAMAEKKGNRSLFHACVATHYLHALEAEMEAMRAQEKKFQAVFAVVNWIAAITAVVSFVALTFASGGAAAPAGVAAIFAFIEGADAVATALVLALTAVEVMAHTADAREQWRQAVAGLTLETPETLRALGPTLDSMGAMGWEMGAQLVLMVLKQKTVRLADAALGLRLGIPNRIVLFRRTLELRYLADDIGAVATEGAIVFVPVKAAP
jgi:hypothetical protein